MSASLGVEEQVLKPPLRAVIVGADAHASALKDVCALFPDLEVAGEFKDPGQMPDAAGPPAYDVAFLDIDALGRSALELGHRLHQAEPRTAVVFVAAAGAYAVEAFEIPALDYLMKPVTAKRLGKTLERLRRRGFRGRMLRPGALQCRVRCFGRFDVLAGGGGMECLSFRSLKGRELLAYLVHHRGFAVPKVQIMEEVWPDLTPDRASVYLHTCIYQIRKVLKANGIEERIRIQSVPKGYRLTLEDVELDVDLFRATLAQLPRAGKEAPVLLARAIRLYGSGLFDQDAFPWAAEPRRSYEMEYRRLLIRMAEYHLEQHDEAGAAEQVRLLVRMDPLNETYHEWLLRLYARTGDRAALAGHYARMLEVFEAELGLPPRDSTLRLYRELTAFSHEQSPMPARRLSGAGASRPRLLGGDGIL